MKYATWDEFDDFIKENIRELAFILANSKNVVKYLNVISLPDDLPEGHPISGNRCLQRVVKTSLMLTVEV